MIELVHNYKKVWSMYTLASLLDKTASSGKDDIRLHLYVHEDDWDEAPREWILDNFPNVKIYQSFWRTDNLAKTICHLKSYYTGKEKQLNKRIIYFGGNRIMLGAPSKNMPPADFFKGSVSFLSRKAVFHDHPTFKHYYNTLGLWSEQRVEEIDPEIVILNWDKLKKFSNDELFCYEQRNNLKPGWDNLHEVDKDIFMASDRIFLHNLMRYAHQYMPRYMNGKNDLLIQLDSIGPKDCINYNAMLRKSWTLNIQHKWLGREYYDCPTGVQLALPWDSYSSLISKIPLNFRDARMNELILLKSEKQKRTSRELIKVGFKLGKL